MRIHAISLSPMSNAQKRRLKALGDLEYYEAVLGDTNTGELCRGAEILVTTPRLSVDIIPYLDDCRMISVQAVGTDAIDLAAARARGITVCNVPEFCTDAVAEHAIAMLLGLVKRLEEGRSLLEVGGWNSALAYKTLGLRDKTLGIFGLGKIGSRIAEIARDGFKMRVIATVLNTSRARQFETVGLEHLLSESDFVVIAAPATPETHNLFSRQTFSYIKQGAMIVNVSRAALIDDNALIMALDDGQLAGAAVDVFRTEPPSPDDPLLTHPKVLVSPHVAWGTEDAVARLLDISIENVESFLAGKTMNIVS
jgi:phosphoglycerate dehydrogenase-like enzyme